MAVFESVSSGVVSNRSVQRALINHWPLRREHLLKGKHHCMADLMFILFEFSCFAYVKLAIALLVWSNQN